MYIALYVFVVLFPFMVYPWGIIPDYTKPKAEALTWFMLLIWLLFIWKWLRSRPHPVLGKLRPADWAALAFIFLVWLSAFLSKDLHTSIYGNQTRKEGLIAIFSYITLYFFSSRFIPTAKSVLLLWGFAISSGFVSVYGILQHFLLDFLPRSFLLAGYTRSFAFFDNPNFFGTYLVLAIVLTTTLYLMTSNKYGIWISIISISVHFTALTYSQTRSGWLGAIVGFAVLTGIVVVPRPRLWKRWGVLLVVLTALFFGINYSEHGAYSKRADSILTDANQAMEGNAYAGSSRWYIWGKALPLVGTYFWHGSGPDTFAEVFPKNREEYQKYLHNPDIVVDKAHNEYLQIAVTMGFPALLAYLLMIGLILQSCQKSFHKMDEPRKIMHAGLAAAILGYLAQAFFNISVVTVAPFYWVVLGLAYRLGARKF